ncbi:MAG: hypothetical protein J1E85_10175 [Ruminococcus sp.]|nr:hypothetical protein [Ruminococcus sp.]
MKEKLLELQKQNKNISIYCCEDNNKFIYGKLLSVNDYEFALLMYTPLGKFDGIIVKRIEEITHIEYDGQYEQKMQKILSQNIDTKKYYIDDSLITNSILELSLKLNKIVSIELLNSGYDNVVGFVDEIYNNKCTIKLVDEYGYDDGYSCIIISDITQIVLDSERESLFLKLWQINKNSTTN